MFMFWKAIAVLCCCAIFPTHCLLNETPIKETNADFVDFELSITSEEKNDNVDNADLSSQNDDYKYALTFQATGCPNKNPDIAWWKTQSDHRVFRDMLKYCTLVRDGKAVQRQKLKCCGKGNDCKPISCDRQSTWIKDFQKKERAFCSPNLSTNWEDLSEATQKCAENGECVMFVDVKGRGTTFKYCKSGAKISRSKKRTILYGKPVDCVWSDWTIGECSQTCGEGKRTNTRTKVLAQFGGKECEGEGSAVEDCNLPECPDCENGNSWCETYVNIYGGEVCKEDWFTDVNGGYGCLLSCDLC